MSIINHYKEKIINIYGWTGSITIIIAYILGLNCNSNENNNYYNILVNSLNIYGSLSIGFICYRQRIYQALILEVIWFIVSVYSLVEILQ